LRNWKLGFKPARLIGWPGNVCRRASDDLSGWHLLWDERAAILEYEHGLSREEAEALVLADVLRLMKETGRKLGL
jgi:hypothetical protein